MYQILKIQNHSKGIQIQIGCRNRAIKLNWVVGSSNRNTEFKDLLNHFSESNSKEDLRSYCLKCWKFRLEESESEYFTGDTPN